MNRVLPPGAPPIDCFQVLLQSHTMMAYLCIATLPSSRPQSALYIYSIIAPKCISIHTQFSLAKCMSKFTRSWLSSSSLHSLSHGLHVYLHTHPIMVFKFPSSWPSSSSANSPNRCLQVHLSIQSIVILRHTSHCSQAPCAVSLDIPCVDG